MVIGPSHRVRRAGDVRCAQITDGSAARVASMSKARSVSAMSSRRDGALVLPACLEVHRERVDPAEMLDLLRAGSELQGIGVETESVDGGGGEQREALGSGLGGAGALQQSMRDDDIGTRQLVAPGDATPDEGPMVDEHLEVEPRCQPTRVAVAGRRLVDAPQSTPEGEVGRLDRVEQQRPVGAPVLDEQERGITLELGQSERRLEAADDRLQEVTGDGRRVLDLAPGEVRGVAGQIGEDQEACFGCRCHVVNRRPWSRSNVNTRSSCRPWRCLA